jgi:hypothetical protein
MLRFSTLAVLFVAAINGCSSGRFARNCSPCCPTYVCRPVCAIPCQPTSCNFSPRPCSSCGASSMDSFGGGTNDQVGAMSMDTFGSDSMAAVGYPAN